MTTAHIHGLPIEESLLQLAPAGAATVTLAVLAARARLGRLWTRVRRLDSRWRTA
jgi:hypothetical protein